MGKAQMEGYDYFDEYMIDTWNETVNEDDNILHLGDFAFKDAYKVAGKLKGNVTLIVGNHDKPKHITFYKELGWRVIDNIALEIENKEDIYTQLENKFYREKLNHKLLACLIKDINNTRVMFSHFPVFDDNPYDEKYKEFTDILEELYIISDCDINIHGHTHSAGAKENFCKSACLELNDFRILNVQEVVNKV